MGYEIKLSFYPRKEDKSYDTETPDTFTKTIGKHKEVPIQVLANYLIRQLSRRDILVFDIKIFEFIKREISFKECANGAGVIIKNKKFMLDGTIEDQEEVQEQQRPQQHIPEQRQFQQEPLFREPPPKLPSVARWEMYTPDPTAVHLKKYNLTPNKKYAIMEERTVPQRVNINGHLQEMAGIEYRVQNDLGENVFLEAIHFSPLTSGLSFQNLINQTNLQNQPQPRLAYMQPSVDASMPVLRR